MNGNFDIPRPIIIPKDPEELKQASFASSASNSESKWSSELGITEETNNYHYKNKGRSPKSRTSRARSSSPKSRSGSPKSPLNRLGATSPLAMSQDTTLSNYDLVDAVNSGSVKHCNMVIDSLILKLIINKCDSRGMTPLHLAARVGDIDMIINLLQRGADSTLKDIMGWTPMFWCCMEGHVDVLDFFLSKADREDTLNEIISSVDGSNATLLHHAAMEGYAEMVQLLINRGCDIHIEDNFGQTAVQRACTHNHEEAALILMEAGADFTLPEGVDQEHLSPLQQACVLFLEDFGFPAQKRFKTFADAQTWTKEDGIILDHGDDDDDDDDTTITSTTTDNVYSEKSSTKSFDHNNKNKNNNISKNNKNHITASSHSSLHSPDDDNDHLVSGSSKSNDRKSWWGSSKSEISKSSRSLYK